MNCEKYSLKMKVVQYGINIMDKYGVSNSSKLDPYFLKIETKDISKNDQIRIDLFIDDKESNIEKISNLLIQYSGRLSSVKWKDKKNLTIYFFDEYRDIDDIEDIEKYIENKMKYI